MGDSTNIYYDWWLRITLWSEFYWVPEGATWSSASGPTSGEGWWGSGVRRPSSDSTGWVRLHPKKKKNCQISKKMKMKHKISRRVGSGYTILWFIAFLLTNPGESYVIPHYPSHPPKYYWNKDFGEASLKNSITRSKLKINKKSTELGLLSYSAPKFILIGVLKNVFFTK